MNQSKSKEGYNGIYLERSGVDFRELTESLLAPPEIMLDESEKAEIYAFDKLLSENCLPSGCSIREVISAHADETSLAPMFFAKGIMEMSAAELDDDAPQFESSDDVYKWLAGCVKENSKTPKELLQIAKQSARNYKIAMSECLQADQAPDPAIIDRMPLVIDPVKYFKQATGVDEARDVLKDLRKDYHEGGAPTDGAKRVLIDIYLAKINSLLSTDIIFANYLLDQSRLIDDDETADLASISVSSSLLKRMENPDTKESAVKRLDYIRNGRGTDMGGHGSAVSFEISTSAENPESGLYSEAQVEILKNVMLTPMQMIDAISNVLQRANLLSLESADDRSPDRVGRAVDQKYQVTENPGADSFAVSGNDGLFKVASEPRSLYDLIVVGSHELTHIAQSEADVQMGRKFAIAKLKGKRVSMIREAGANATQREVEKKLFGTSKPIAITYASALRKLESGGDLGEATHAFYDEKIKAFPSIDRKVAANEAADRVLRLVRCGGINSKAMAYAEESILNKEMQGASDEVRNRATLITCLDLVDQQKLHKYGLLPEAESHPEKLVELLLNELMPHIDSALSQSSDIMEEL